MKDKIYFNFKTGQTLLLLVNYVLLMHSCNNPFQNVLHFQSNYIGLNNQHRINYFKNSKHWNKYMLKWCVATSLKCAVNDVAVNLLCVVCVEVRAWDVMTLHVPLHVGLVLEFGLQQWMFDDPDANVHHHHLLFHPGQRLPDVDKWSSVGHAAPPLLHLGLDGLQFVGNLAQGSRTFSHSATHLR